MLGYGDIEEGRGLAEINNSANVTVTSPRGTPVSGDDGHGSSAGRKRTHEKAKRLNINPYQVSVAGLVRRWKICLASLTKQSVAGKLNVLRMS